jgi:hypothetical protein
MKRLRFLAFAVVLCAPTLALAQPKNDAATAQALFYEARALMRDRKYAQACPKLEESLRLDYGMGTEFNLADCNEKMGKIAAAWSGFINVAAAAAAQNQAQREKVARDRAKQIEPRLPKLVVEVASPAPGLEVRRDNVVLGAAAWGTASPVEPGSHRIVASAPGRVPFDVTVTAIEGKTMKVAIPGLAPVVVAPELPRPAVSEPPPPPAPIATTFPEPVIERPNNAQRTVGFVVGALGVGALGVGAGFGIDSLSKRERAKDHCTGDLCDESGLALRDRAIASGNIATITSIAGGVAIATGLVLVLTAPKDTRESRRGLLFSPHVAQGGGGLSLQGHLP